MNKGRLITRKDVLWNTASGMINAGQSALILIFISHYLPRGDAGVFTIAYALGNLFSTMGKYGVRNFQVTDVRENHSFSDYRVTRIVTSIAALLALLVYMLIQHLTGSLTAGKFAVVFWICLWKMIDSMEDVYYGMYQQKGRLDLGARNYTIRITLSTVLFCVLLLMHCSLVTASALVAAVSAVLAVILVRTSIGQLQVAKAKTDCAQIFDILKVCFPLFLGTSLSIYIGNAPKYLIDWYLDDQAQAIFGYIMMPAFVILVLNQFIYQPMIRGLGVMWQNRERKRFVRRVWRQYLIVAGITVVIIAGGILVGIPLLSLLYNVDLAPYKAEFAVILLGGGVYALVSFIMVPLTAMRFQKCISYGFGGAAVLSLLVGKAILSRWGVMGASLLYLLLNTALAVFFTACFVYRGKQTDEDES